MSGKTSFKKKSLAKIPDYFLQNVAEMALWCDDLPRLLHVTMSTWSFAEENHSITVLVLYWLCFFEMSLINNSL